ncbi:hypothetical protein Tco_0595388 [Tanacetum coccineum]
MIQDKEMMQDKDLKHSKSKDKGLISRSQSMKEQSHYKQEKTKTDQKNAKHKSQIISSTLKEIKVKSRYPPTRMSSFEQEGQRWGERSRPQHWGRLLALIRRCNNYAVLQNIPCSPECKIVGQLLLDHPLSNALTATTDIPVLLVETPTNPFITLVTMTVIEPFMQTVGYQGVCNKASVYSMGNATVRGMLIPDAFITNEIHVTDDYKEYETVFVGVVVLMIQPKPFVSTQGTHRTTPSTHRLPTLSVRDEIAEATLLSLTLHKTTIAAKAQENVGKVQDKLVEEEIEKMFEGKEDEESYDREFADSVFNDDDDDSVAMTKVMKEEFEKLELFEINENLFTYDTQLGMIFKEFNRLSRINDALFTWEIEVPKPTPSVEQQTSDPKHNDPREYEWKINYDECENIYAEAVIFINKRLIRLIDVTIEQWLDLIYGDHKTMDKNVKKAVIDTWLIRSYKLQFKEYLEIKRQRETYTREINMEYNPSNLVFAEWLASKFYNHLEMDWYTKNALWVYWMRRDDEVILSDEEFNYLLKVDAELFTHDIERTKTYEDYESDLNNEDDEPRSEDGVPYEVSAYAVSRFLDMTPRWKEIDNVGGISII